MIEFVDGLAGVILSHLFSNILSVATKETVFFIVKISPI